MELDKSRKKQKNMIFGNVFSTDRNVYLGGTRVVSRFRRTEETL